MLDDRQRQLTSTWLNIMGAGIVSGGIVSQMVTLASSTTSITTSAALVILCIVTGAGLHGIASVVTRGQGPGR